MSRAWSLSSLPGSLTRIESARDLRESAKRGEELGLIEDEKAFYDALETNDSAVKVLGDDAFRTIAR